MKILSLSSFIPEHICDITRFTGYNGNIKISQYCGYTSDYISQILEDKSVDGAVFPRSCDSCRVLGSYLLDNSKSDKFIYQFSMPARQDHTATQYLAKEIKIYQDKVERYYDIKINDIKERTELINNRNSQLKKLYDNISYVSYGKYILMINDMLNKPLKSQYIDNILEPKCDIRGGRYKKIYIIGSFITNINLLYFIEQCGLSIIGDNLTQSKRLFSVDKVMTNGDIYENIAKSMISAHKSPTQNNFKDIINNDISEIKNKSADGVIFITQKYCEPYDYLYSVYKQALDELNIPSLKLTLTDSCDSKNLEFAIEAFSDIL